MPPSTDASTTAGAPTDRQAGAPAPRTGTDDTFALVTGLYVAATVVPLTLAWLDATRLDAATLYLLALVSGTVVWVGVALVVRRTPGLGYRLGASSGRWALLAVPLVAAVLVTGGRVLVAPGVTPSGVAIYALAAFAGGVLVATVLVTMARTRYTKAVETGVETPAEWRAAWPKSRRGVPKVVGGLAVAAGVAAFAVGFTAEMSLVRGLGNLLLPVGIVFFMFGHNSRTYRATTAGLVRQMPANREFYDWDRFEGYAVDDDAVVVYFRVPWRFPIICARDELDEEGVVLDAISEQLPRLPAR